MTLLSIIIVNYKTPGLLADCLASIYRETTQVQFEIIVVDNASWDNSRELTLTAFPSVKWIQMEYNAGFARANNAGIRSASGDTVLLLNSDTIIIDRAIERSYLLFAGSAYVACGVQLLNADGSPQISGNYFMSGGLNNLLPLPYVGRFIRRVAAILNVSKPHVPDASAEIQVDWINGAYLMVKKSAIAAAGMMDEDFFLYAEEAEWCYRLKKSGKLVIYGQCKVMHLQGESSNAAFGSNTAGYQNLYDRKGLQIMLSNFVRIRKQFGTGWFLVHLSMYTATIPVFALATLFQCLFNSKDYGRRITLVRLFTANVWRLWQMFPTIIRNKPYFYKVL